MVKKSKNTQSQEKKKVEENQIDKQVLNLFKFMVIIVLIFILIFAFIQSSNKFKYEGIDFKKTKQGSILFYTATVPVLDAFGQKAKDLSIDFRNDPRDLKEIPVNITNGIHFIYNQKVYVSYDQFGVCENNGLAGINLGRFIANIGFDVAGAINDITHQNNTNSPYVNCETNPDNTVIRIINGTETKIIQTGENCYEIHFKDCEILEATEKFELTRLEQYS